MPSSSRFSSLADAQQYLVELFAAFTSDLKTERISTVRINRGIWNISVVEDSRAQYDYMQNRSPFTHETTRLDSIFYVEDLPYYWHRLNH